MQKASELRCLCESDTKPVSVNSLSKSIHILVLIRFFLGLRKGLSEYYYFNLYLNTIFFKIDINYNSFYLESFDQTLKKHHIVFDKTLPMHGVDFELWL